MRIPVCLFCEFGKELLITGRKVFLLRMNFLGPLYSYQMFDFQVYIKTTGELVLLENPKRIDAALKQIQMYVHFYEFRLD